MSTVQSENLRYIYAVIITLERFSKELFLREKSNVFNTNTKEKGERVRIMRVDINRGSYMNFGLFWNNWTVIYMYRKVSTRSGLNALSSPSHQLEKNY